MSDKPAIIPISEPDGFAVHPLPAWVNIYRRGAGVAVPYEDLAALIEALKRANSGRHMRETGQETA